MKQVKAGEITLGTVLRVSDPCYTSDTWCAGTISPMRAGRYLCTIELDDEDEWQDCPYSITVRHADEPDVEPTLESGIDVGVDSASCGFYDEEYFLKTHSGETVDQDWYDAEMDVTFGAENYADVMDGKCFVTRLGGDGSYRCVYGVNDKGERVVARLIFAQNDDEA